MGKYLVSAVIIIAQPFVLLQAAYANLETGCTQLISKQIQPWTLSLTKDIRKKYIDRNGYDPVKVRGDFDGNGMQDIAFLIQQGDTPILKGARGKQSATKVAICLSRKNSTKLELISNTLCNDYIYKEKENIVEADQFSPGTYQIDAIGTICDGVDSVTYYYDGKSFQQSPVD